MNDDQRQRLAESHRFLVWKAVRLIWPRVKRHVEKSELVSQGDLGLSEAASRYDPDGGASFATFAWYRVQGSIIDWLRRQAYIPRRVWAELVALRAAAEVLEAQGRREAAARQQGAEAPQSTADRLRAIKEAMASVEAIYATSMRVSLDEGMHTPEAEPPTAEFERAGMRHKVDEALASLPAKERDLIRKHYAEGKSLVEAGEEMGLSKSWASRLHAQAVERLRRRLVRDGP